MASTRHNFDCTPDSITLSWENNSRYCGNYVIKYRKSGGTKKSFTDTKTNDTTFSIPDLQRKTEYEIKAYVEDDEGDIHLLFTEVRFTI